ncbi:SHOCT domain-containing protein [Saccharopolyspora griseoalba]|uniref:SHOCT domain-containing protein n=1 Tax=Saccharopolyspora griseoalba TaxID=1431848 RepID=A0ABW2LIX4_9PSEU
MTWQDELQNLDAELAAGRISAEEYRQRRDALLAREQDDNSAGFPQEDPSGEPGEGEGTAELAGEEPTRNVQPVPGEEPTRNVEPVAGQEPTAQVAQPGEKDPFPPAFSWSDAAKQGAQQTGTGEETTQVVRPFAQPAEGSGPHSVTPPPPPQWGPPQAAQAPWPQQPQPQQPAWGPVETTGTPWGDGLPGSTETGDAPWMRQGPEVFEGAGKPGKGKLITGLFLGAVLLVAVIVAAVFFFTSRGDDRASEPSPAAPPPPAPTATSDPLPEPPAAKPAPGATPEALVAVPGPPHPWAGPLDVPSLQGPKSGLLPQGLAQTALQNGLVEGWFNGTDGVDPKSTLIALKLPDQEAAKTVADKYLDNQRGLSEVESLSYQGVPVVSTGGTFRTAYVAHNYAIILDVSGDPAAEDAARGAFKTLLDQQLAQTPPTAKS